MSVTAQPQLSPHVEQKLALALPRLIAAFDPERIYLYGSQARGDATTDSDIDVLVVMPDGFRGTVQDYYRASDVLGRDASSVSVLFWTISGYKERLPLLASLPATVEREGWLLYER